MTRHLFVYGTLKRDSDHPMAGRLAKEAAFTGTAEMAGRLVDLGAYPGLLPPQEDDERVAGEVFELRDPEAMLPVLDAYEGEEYARAVRSASLEDGRRIDAWVYLYRGDSESATMRAPE